MESCSEHRYIQESFQDFKVQVEAIHKDIRILTDMTSQILKDNAIMHTESKQLRVEVDQIWECVTSTKTSINDIVLTRERIVGEFNSEKESIRKDLKIAFDRLRKGEEANIILSEKLHQLIMVKDELNASLRTIKYIAGLAPVIISTLIYLIMKLYHV